MGGCWWGDYTIAAEESRSGVLKRVPTAQIPIAASKSAKCIWNECANLSTGPRRPGKWKREPEELAGCSFPKDEPKAGTGANASHPRTMAGREFHSRPVCAAERHAAADGRRRDRVPRAREPPAAFAGTDRGSIDQATQYQWRSAWTRPRRSCCGSGSMRRSSEPLPERLRHATISGVPFAATAGSMKATAD
jgi:hypothetical protein